MPGDAEVRCDLQRAEAGEDGRAGVALFLRAVPIGGIMPGPERFHIVRRAFGFLQTENVRLLGVEKFKEIFLQHGAHAIDVPGDQLHAGKLTHGGAQINTDLNWAPVFKPGPANNDEDELNEKESEAGR